MTQRQGRAAFSACVAMCSDKALAQHIGEPDRLARCYAGVSVDDAYEALIAERDERQRRAVA